MEEPTSTCSPHDCPLHFHASDPVFVKEDIASVAQSLSEEQHTVTNRQHTSAGTVSPKKRTTDEEQDGGVDLGSTKDLGFRRIIRNFTPS